MWVVEAQAESGNGTYTYLVDAPQDADPMQVACCAYAQHGILFFDEGAVAEKLGPIHQAYWQEVTTWEPVSSG